MRILIAIEQTSWSDHTLRQVAGFAGNTWADITLFGVVPQTSDATAVPQSFVDTMNRYHQSFLEGFDPSSCPYAPFTKDATPVRLGPGIVEMIHDTDPGFKDLTVRIQVGKPVKSILTQAHELGCDLIVLHGEMDSRHAIATKAECSVLVVKEEKESDRILCFLDDDLVTQRSLELITQMTALFEADLEIAGLTEKKRVKTSVENKLDWLLRYFLGKDIQPWLQVVALADLERFILEEDHWSLITMWLGTSSMMERIFSKDKVARLLNSSRASILLLR